MSEYLCYDIVYNILTRLPTTSIVRFIIVCKQWHDILTDSKFWENHRLVNPRPNILFISNQNKMMNLSINIPNCPELICRVNNGGYYFGGTSNGFILLAPIINFNNHIIIFNPITRKHVTISSESKFTKIGGFGYSRVSKQYKILTIHNYYNGSFELISHISFWTLGSAEPSRVIMEDLDLNIGESLCINGTIYADFIESSENILAFNIETETWTYVECPFSQRCSKFMQIGERLCMASIEKNDIFIWLLNDNGWNVSYILKGQAENQGVLGVWELENALLVGFLNEKFFLYDRIVDEKMMDRGEKTDFEELLKHHKDFVDMSKFSDRKWRLCWGYEPTLESTKIFENFEAKFGAMIEYEQGQSKE